MQEVFLTLWRDPTQFDPSRGGLATWLMTLIHQQVVHAVRKETAIRRPIVAPEAGEDWSPTPLPSADAAAGQRRVLALTYFGGHTQREIAVPTGVPLGTVTSRTFAAVQRLRALLTDQWDPDGLIADTDMVREVN